MGDFVGWADRAVAAALAPAHSPARQSTPRSESPLPHAPAPRWWKLLAFDEAGRGTAPAGAGTGGGASR